MKVLNIYTTKCIKSSKLTYLLIDNITKEPVMEDLPLEKQFTHRCFCDVLENIEDVEMLKHELGKLHLLYLRQQVVFTQIVKGCLPMPQNP
jgi:hypothetical protein